MGFYFWLRSRVFQGFVCVSVVDLVWRDWLYVLGCVCIADLVRGRSAVLLGVPRWLCWRFSVPQSLRGRLCGAFSVGVFFFSLFFAAMCLQLVCSIGAGGAAARLLWWLPF